ncbi:MAG: hypothetical protein ABSA78_19550 [Candidatus Sulfotelmatobacter sp.]|jgi:hypothetical protein
MADDDKPGPLRARDLLDDDHVRLALEKQVRDLTDAYLKRLGAFALIVLAVAGYSTWNIVSGLKDQQKELQGEQKELREETVRLQGRSLDAQKSALDAQRGADSVTEKANDAEKSRLAAQSASNTAAEAAQKLSGTVEGARRNASAAVVEEKEFVQKASDLSDAARKSKEDADGASKNAGVAFQKADTAQSRAEAAAVQAIKRADVLNSLLPAQIQLTISRESQELLVRGKKTPCVELRNWVEPDGLSLRPESDPQKFYVRFRVRHIHLRPVDLYMEVRKDSCPSDDTMAELPKKGTPDYGEIFEYSGLPKNLAACREDNQSPIGEGTADSQGVPGDASPSCAHRIPRTPFAFQMTFVYDPLFTYDFVVLSISPQKELLKAGPPYRSPSLYHDEARRLARSADAFR